MTADQAMDIVQEYGRVEHFVRDNRGDSVALCFERDNETGEYASFFHNYMGHRWDVAIYGNRHECEKSMTLAFADGWVDTNA